MPWCCGRGSLETLPTLLSASLTSSLLVGRASGWGRVGWWCSSLMAWRGWGLSTALPGQRGSCRCAGIIRDKKSNNQTLFCLVMILNISLQRMNSSLSSSWSTSTWLWPTAPPLLTISIFSEDKLPFHSESPWSSWHPSLFSATQSVSHHLMIAFQAQSLREWSWKMVLQQATLHLSRRWSNHSPLYSYYLLQGVVLYWQGVLWPAEGEKR